MSDQSLYPLDIISFTLTQHHRCTFQGKSCTSSTNNILTKSNQYTAEMRLSSTQVWLCIILHDDILNRSELPCLASK